MPIRNLFFTALFFAIAESAFAQIPSTTNVGHVTIDAKQSEISSGYVIYRTVHMVTQSGATLDADEVRGNLAASGGGLANAVATGHVKAHVEQIADGRTYTIVADKAVFDPKTNEIDLTGSVVATVISGFTDGPLTQKGDSGTILLGKAPEFPKIIMYDVVTQFTPQQ